MLYKGPGEYTPGPFGFLLEKGEQMKEELLKNFCFLSLFVLFLNPSQFLIKPVALLLKQKL